MKKPIRVDRLAYKTIGIETIILDTKIGKEVHQLNEVASVIWHLCDGKHTISDISDVVCETFDVDPLDASADIEKLLTELVSKSLVKDNEL